MKNVFRFVVALILAVGLCRPAEAPAQGASGQGQQGAQAQPGQQPAPAAQPTPEELQAFQGIRNELDPDRAVQLVSDFEKKFASSPLMSFVCTFAIGAYQQKGDVQHAVEYGEKSLKLNPDNLLGLMMMSELLPQPQVLRASEMDKEKKLADAEKYANRGLQLIEQANHPQFGKQAGETDEQYKKRKDTLSSSLHASLGLIHLQRSQLALQGPDREELAKAEQEYKAAVTLTDRPDPSQYYRLGEAYAQDNKADEAIAAFSKASELSEGTPLKTLADQRVEQLKKKKSEAKSAAKP